jgi:hypothetical protein
MVQPDEVYIETWRPTYVNARRSAERHVPHAAKNPSRKSRLLRH